MDSVCNPVLRFGVGTDGSLCNFMCGWNQDSEVTNGVLGYQKDAEDVKYGGFTSACHFAPVDHAAIARACGSRGVRVETADDYLPAVQEALASDVTTVIDVMTDPEAFPPITFFEGALEAVRAERGNHRRRTRPRSPHFLPLPTTKRRRA